jgi:hypothetical protein
MRRDQVVPGEGPKSPSALDKLIAGFKELQANQPSLGAEFRSWIREGREDLLNVLLKPFPDSMDLTREPGAPGSPTTPQVTSELTGRPLVMELDMDR